MKKKPQFNRRNKEKIKTKPNKPDYILKGYRDDGDSMVIGYGWDSKSQEGRKHISITLYPLITLSERDNIRIYLFENVYEKDAVGNIPSDIADDTDDTDDTDESETVETLPDEDRFVSKQSLLNQVIASCDCTKAELLSNNGHRPNCASRKK